MHYLKCTFPFILAAVTLASAQHPDTTSTTSVDNAATTNCAAENAIKQCVESMKSNLNGCAPNDQTCLCTNSASAVDCYQGCPDDSAKADAQSVREQNCAKSAGYMPISTTSVTMSTTSISTSASSSGTTSAKKPASTDSTNEIGSDSDVDSGFKEGHPTKSYSGLESNNDVSDKAKEGVASSLKSLTTIFWCGLLGLSLGIIW